VEALRASGFFFGALGDVREDLGHLVAGFRALVPFLHGRLKETVSAVRHETFKSSPSVGCTRLHSPYKLFRQRGGDAALARVARTVEVNVHDTGAMRVGSRVILMVDDNADFAELTRTILLQGEGITDEVRLACDGVEAIEYLFHPERAATEMPDLVLLDLSMPRMDGFRVLSKMRAAEQTMFIPVVILSSSVHPEDVRSAYGLGANGYLDKLSDEVPWDEMVRATARYWLGMNITPNSFAGQKDWISRARKSPSYGGENWRRTPDLAKLRDLPREEAIRVATLIYGWSAAEASERVDTAQRRNAEGMDNREKQHGA